MNKGAYVNCSQACLQTETPRQIRRSPQNKGYSLDSLWLIFKIITTEFYKNITSTKNCICRFISFNETYTSTSNQIKKYDFYTCIRYGISIPIIIISNVLLSCVNNLLYLIFEFIYKIFYIMVYTIQFVFFMPITTVYSVREFWRSYC
uniref:Uncharacterized protein n=1 Tax=viral metagenome TaxID=1070528 RepID=A0A6C0JAN3_9ZZZZ